MSVSGLGDVYKRQVYEWDSQHGGLETYKPNSNNTSFYHLGESSAVQGNFSAKAISKRDNNFVDTGIPGVKMKDLCKKHKSGKLKANDLKRSRVKNSLKCL